MAKFWQFKNQTGTKDPELLVYGEISEWYGVDSKSFAEELKNISATNINVRINSPGGEVFAAQAIYSMLKRHPARVTVFIDGIAASAATIIAMAGDKVVMPENAMMMIHNPLIWTYGNANEMREVADLLDKVRETLLAVYRDKTGLPDDQLIELLDAETYLTAGEAKDLGFVDEVEQAVKVAATLTREKMVVNGIALDPERFAKMPESWLNKPAAKENPKPTGPAGNNQPKEIKTMDLEKLKAEHPDLYTQIVNEGKEAGIKAERDRIKAIEEMALPGYDQLTNKAKFETGITAEAFAIDMVKAEKASKQKFLNDRQADADEMENPGNDPADPGVKPEAKKDEEQLNEWKASAAKVGQKRGSFFNHKS